MTLNEILTDHKDMTGQSLTATGRAYIQAEIMHALRAAIPEKLPEWSITLGGQHVQDKDAHNYNVGIDRFTKNIERNLGIDITKKEESIS